ncbi:hypothetical protein T440DRAFT_497472 [Plenodomus tracheiphilus IPT5]|uniref:Fungal N-terminal domain-containing protein n=1 Tax=Plenodomus tracheiphilus IPT5 TaxID=1408161 RepID=A0A6A7BBU9_9PLEO|nr:hypothetical protein T440DRAFT_497472 [Plenodomus tracheiphilus IPT5]
MDGASSVIAVVSLSLQLIESISKIKKFLRDVKEAHKELARLIDLLDLLAALLQDVHDNLRKQESWQGQYIPLPSNTIVRCVQGCEGTIKPLRELVQKYSTPAAGTASLTKLKRDIKVAIKAKDIVGYETRVEREIGYLQAAVGTNMTSILFDTLPTLVQGQEVIMTRTASLNNRTPIAPEVVAMSSDQSFASPSNVRPSRCVREVQCVSPLLATLGLRCSKVTRHYRTGSLDPSRRSSNHQDEIIVETDERSLVWTRVGYSISWSQSHSWGNILPSLRVTPIVRDFDSDVLETIYNGSVQELQQLFTSGKIHPYTRDQWGQSLLHIAAEKCQPDVCQMLLQYGVKSGLSSGTTVLMSAISYLNCRNSPLAIGTLRVLMSSKEVIDDIVYASFSGYGWRLSSEWSPESFEWLWKQLESMYADEDLAPLRSKIFSFALYGFAHSVGFGVNGRAPKFNMTSRTRDNFKSDDIHILVGSLSSYGADTSFVVGAAIVKVLLEHGLDVEVCCARMRHSFDANRNLSIQRFISERVGEQDWILGFKWVFEPQGSGYLLVHEFTALVVESRLELHTDFWPFAREYARWGWPGRKYDDPKRQSRFARRMASKARKERARNGQKRPRSRMPGGWI